MSLFSKHALGIDISDSSIEMLELKEKGKSLQVVAYRRLELPDGIVKNGRIIDQNILVGKLKETASAPGYGRFTAKSAVVSLPESQVYIHLFRLPAVISARQLGEAIQYEAEETLPLFWDQTVHDYQIVSQDKDNQDVLYVACPKDIVHSYQQAIGDAGYELQVLEAESASLARALVSVQASDPTLMIDCGARTTILTIYDQQTIHFSENIPIAGRQITDAVMGKLSVPMAEAESMKKKTGLLSLPTAQAIEPALAAILAAINKAIRLYSKNSGRTVKQILLCGGTSLLPGLAQYFSNQLHIPTLLGNPLDGVAQSDNIFNTQPPILFSTVIGLAKRGLNDRILQSGINLLDHGKNKDKLVANAGAKGPSVEPVSIPRGNSWAARNKRGLIMLGVFAVLAAAFAVLYYIKMVPKG
jgi:type IV pilus assembly protein PilM